MGAISPKQKISKARRNSRRANWKLSLPTIGKCPRCQAFKLSHRMCGQCGYYDGQQIVNMEADKPKKAKA